MIPHLLRLANFMCYREEQALDFTGIHLACLAGDNGHGKSALLDAMTWALWGRSRAGRDDDLIALGENEMWVEFTFGLGPLRYQVKRQRSKRGRGQSDLHFSVWDGASEQWRLLDDGNLRDRQHQITRTLRMDYDTFVNSAFLLQGHADSFTVRTPAERKQILGDILGLDRYDRYEARAKELAQEFKARAAALQGEIGAIDRDLERRPELESQAAQAAATLAAAAESLRTADGESGRLRTSVQELRALDRQLVDLRARLTRAERDFADVGRQLTAAQGQVATFEVVLTERADIEAGWQALCAAREAERAWGDRLLRHSEAQATLTRAQAALDRAHAALESELQQLVVRRAELAQRRATGEQQARALTALAAELAELDLRQARRDAIGAALREVGEQSGALRAEMERLKTEGQSVREKADLMSEGDDAACPVCGQALGSEHRARVLADFAADRERLLDRYHTAQADAKALATRQKALESEDGELAASLRRRDSLQRQAAAADVAIAAGKEAAAEDARLAEAQAALSQRLEAGDYASEARKAVAAAERDTAGAGYDPAAHGTARASVQELTPFDARYQRQLLPALEGVDAARARAGELAAQAERSEAELAQDRAQVQALASEVAGLPALEASLKRAEAAGEVAATAERRARQQEGAARQQLDALDVLAGRRQSLTAGLEGATGEISLYNELREAFGKKGLQAMIIESAIPEVEVEANRLLARMTDGRMSIRLETQREKVTGGVAETLDIILADELGSRPYELYSGGESFRANLALRIAISKLLARRAGAQLQTLVVDEGFGSQDSQGRALVVEAIHSIQHDFERILVITHIDELKDLFPARIDVVKTDTGSHVMVG